MASPSLTTEVGKKLFSIIESNHPDCDLDSVKLELSLMEEHDVCSDMLNLYNKVRMSQPGQKNGINSLVAYLLGVTTKKPNEPVMLEKRRTYGRSGFPDIDMDFNHYRRHEVAEYLFKKYGRGHVSNIGTIQRLTTKNCIHKTIMVLDPERSVVFDSDGTKIKEDRSENFGLRMNIVGTLPKYMKRSDGSFVETVEEAYNEYSDFRQQMDNYPEVYKVSKRMEGGISAFGSHAAGFVISPIPLSSIAPLHVTTGQDNSNDDSSSSDVKEKTMATQFTAADAESLGLIKFDVLGLLTKTVITMTTDLIYERYSVKIDVDKLSTTDPTTLAFLRTAKTDGCFQLEEPGMQRTVREIGIDTFDDLTVAIAMYRPGPLAFIPEYVSRKRDPSSVRYIHPIVEKYTKKTYGIIVYQEQAMQIFVDLAGLTTSEGYIFIKGSAKKKPELFQSMKNRFIQGATKRSNKQVAEEVWRQMEPFQGYAFNKSHAVSYAYESWKTAYLKAHYPLEFMASRLSIAALDRKFENVEKFEADCYKRLNIRILPPHINDSKMTYTITDERTFRRPLVIKGIGDKAAEEIVNNQPYKGPDLVESLAMKAGSAVNIAVVEAMCDAGLFGSVKKAKAKKDFETVKADRKKSKGRQTGDLFR